MKARLSLVALLLASSAHAMPPSSAEDDVGRFMAEKRLFERIEEVRQNVGERVTEGASRMAHRASDLVVTAMGFLGVPYRRGGNSAETGFDCSGFVKAMYEQTVGLILPRRANEQAAATQKIEKHDLQPGDLVFFNTLRRTFSHVGIYIGDNKFIHSPRPGAQVRVEDMGVPYWSTRFDGARRVLVAQTPPPAQ
jgi:cell wall-associated NlpC family hydrolase